MAVLRGSTEVPDVKSNETLLISPTPMYGGGRGVGGRRKGLLLEGSLRMRFGGRILSGGLIFRAGWGGGGGGGLWLRVEFIFSV